MTEPTISIETTSRINIQSNCKAISLPEGSEMLLYFHLAAIKIISLPSRYVGRNHHCLHILGRDTHTLSGFEGGHKSGPALSQC